MEEIDKKIADLEVRVQNQQEIIEKLINYLGVDFSKNPKQVLNQALLESLESFQNLSIHIDEEAPSLIELKALMKKK